MSNKDGCFLNSIRLIGLALFVAAFLLICFHLFGCSDGTTTKPKVDTVVTKVDTTIKALVAGIKEAVNRITVITAPTPVEMKEGDNYELLQAIIDKKTGSYLLPHGRFLISKTLKFVESSVTLIGSNTTLDFYPGTDGAEITGGGPTIARIKFSSAPTGNATGIKAHAVVKLIEVWVHGFGGKGFAITADVETAKTNASHSQILFCQASECGDDGLYFQAGDVNACNVIAFDSRDNKGWGINDDSFLGNTFINAMCHSNDKGQYRAENGGNRSAFFGCYAEQDTGPSRFGGVTRVYSGLHGWQVSIDKDGNYYYPGTSEPYKGGGYLITSPYAKVDTQ
jgi:hypothetical protein